MKCCSRLHAIAASFVNLLKGTASYTRFHAHVTSCCDQQIKLVTTIGPQELLSLVRRIKQKAVAPHTAHVILSTVHKAKGLEFDTVVLADGQ
jgi:ATP-dependent exoDNAse (exonuclease V) beta subunit